MSLGVADYVAVQRDITQQIESGMSQANPIFPMFCNVIDSTGEDEKYAWLGDLPGMREWVGDRIFKQLRAADYILANKKWESSLAIEKDKLDDDRLGGYRMQAENLGEEAAFHPDELLFEQVINLAESNACYDGQFFYDTDHSWGDSGTQSNDLTYNMAGSAPTSDEFRAAFHQALIAMLGFKNDRGKPFIRPRVGRLGNLVCRVPVAMYEVANKAFEQQIVLDTAGVSNYFLERPIIIPVQYMGAGYSNGSDVKFDLDYLGGRLKPFVFQARRPLSVSTKGADDAETQLLKFMTDARYNIGYMAWWTSVRTTFN